MGEHLILEESRFTPPVTQELIAWIKTADSSLPGVSIVEAVNSRDLSLKEQQELTKLQKLSKSNSRQPGI